MGGWLKYRANSLMLTGASQISGVGVWVSAPELFPSPIALPKLRQNWGYRWQPPQQIQQLTHEQMALIKGEQQ